MATDAIVIESVSKSFRQRARLWNWNGNHQKSTAALSNVSLSVPRGTVHVLLGPNGSGKTTLLKLVATMLLPDSGRIVINGCDSRRHEKAIAKLSGFAIGCERSFFGRLTARENLDYFAAMDEVPRRERPFRIDELLLVTGLMEHAEKLVMEFSSGMYQRLGIARALLKKPAIALLDEPSRSLDPGSAAQLWQVIRELSKSGTTIVLASHSFQEAAAVADHVSVLRDGELAGKFCMQASCTAERVRRLYFDSLEEEATVTDAHMELDDFYSLVAG
jgi:ABC-2 type transport system ATP-binding protein